MSDDELRKEFQGNWDEQGAWNIEHNTRLKALEVKFDKWRNEANNMIKNVEAMTKHSHPHFKEQIAELKELYQNLWHSHYNFTVVRLNRTDKVLREFGNTYLDWLLDDDIETIDFIKEMKRILEKLDSPKQTEKKEVCEACLYEKTFDTKICAICIPNSNKSQFKPKDSGGSEPEKELYELYLKDRGQYYFKKITHPFTEYNNMVHLAIGKIVVNRSDKQELIEEFLIKMRKCRYLSTEYHNEKHLLNYLNTIIKEYKELIK